jgi:hypothetical protein
MSSSDDDDCASIATTTLQDLALEIQDYMFNSDAKPWYPCPTAQNVIHIQAARWRPRGLVTTMQRLVMDNPDIFHPWVAILDPALVFALRTPIAKRRRFHGVKFRLGAMMVSSRDVRALLQLTRGRLARYSSSPAFIDKVMERGPMDIYDTWYSMSSWERQVITAFFNSLGVNWINTHLP